MPWEAADFVTHVNVPFESDVDIPHSFLLSSNILIACICRVEDTEAKIHSQTHSKTFSTWPAMRLTIVLPLVSSPTATLSTCPASQPGCSLLHL